MCVGMHMNLSLEVILTSCLFHIVWFQAQHQKKKKEKASFRKNRQRRRGRDRETERTNGKHSKCKLYDLPDNLGVVLDSSFFQ